MLKADGSCPEDVSTIVSGFVEPLTVSSAPLVPNEFSHPCPIAPRFPHGQFVASDPSPKQNGTVAPAGSTHDRISQFPA
jgi:hypothetical protein